MAFDCLTSLSLVSAATRMMNLASLLLEDLLYLPCPTQQEGHKSKSHTSPKYHYPQWHFRWVQSCFCHPTTKFTLSTQCNCNHKQTKSRACVSNHLPLPNLMQMRSSTMHIPSDSQQNDPTFFTGFLVNNQNYQLYKTLSPTNTNQHHTGYSFYRSWRYELYSLVVGIAMSHHKISLQRITGFRGGIHRLNLRKNVFRSTVKKTMQRVST